MTVMGWEDKTQCSRPSEGSQLFMPLTKKNTQYREEGHRRCSVILHKSELRAPATPRAHPPDPDGGSPARLHPPAAWSSQNRLRGPKHRTGQAQPAQRALPGPPHAPAPRVPSSSRPSCPRTPGSQKWAGRSPSPPQALGPLPWPQHPRSKHPRHVTSWLKGNFAIKKVKSRCIKEGHLKAIMKREKMKNKIQTFTVDADYVTTFKL